MANKSSPVRLSSEQKIDIIKQILKSLQKGPRIVTRISRNVWDDVVRQLNLSNPTTDVFTESRCQYIYNTTKQVFEDFEEIKDITEGTFNHETHMLEILDGKWEDLLQWEDTKDTTLKPSRFRNTPFPFYDLIKDINSIVEPHDDKSDQPDTMTADITPARHNPTLPLAQVDPTPESNEAMIIIVALCIIREAKGSSEEIDRLFDELPNHPETGTPNAPTTYYKRHEHTQTEIHNILLSLHHEMQRNDLLGCHRIPWDIHTAVANELERGTTTKGLYTPNRCLNVFKRAKKQFIEFETLRATPHSKLNNTPITPSPNHHLLKDLVPNQAPDDRFREKLKKYRASLKNGFTLVQPRHKPNGTYRIRHTRTGKIKKNDLPLPKQNRPTIVLSSDDECMEEALKIINNQARPQVISRDGHSTSDDEQSSTCFEEGNTIEQLQKKL
ncbi:hypothetical protein MJO28_000765 [Puccinia striiformis f. sp. tritici]|uniref:Uncharacterized protein n=1 Tax=Puccinia striiformis f. sp. tritici TaxID=168172 RepID=A0ACC0EZG1_9BASI|nr:hypothetical protein MJO28_000765 [Puccinia striiformis f. sp. tritici]